jgi:hypothetical protein
MTDEKKGYRVTSHLKPQKDSKAIPLFLMPPSARIKERDCCFSKAKK